MDEEQIFIQTLYNLILNPNTRDWERKVLIQTKNDIRENISVKEQLSKLEATLRPLAIRMNLTPDVMDFYLLRKDLIRSKNMTFPSMPCKMLTIKNVQYLQGDVSGVWSSRLNRKKGSYLFCQDTRADMLKNQIMIK